MDILQLSDLLDHVQHIMANPVPLEQVWSLKEIVPCEEFIF